MESYVLRSSRSGCNNSCSYTYAAVIRNDNAPGVIHFKLANWSITQAEKPFLPIQTSDWINHLRATGASASALIAFRWAQFPVEQEYEPGGDWNQGMLSVDLAADSQFDVIAKWDVNGENYQGVLKNVRCAQ